MLPIFMTQKVGYLLLTFMFQVAFLQGHKWVGKSMAVFCCVEIWHDKYCIPELPQQIADADISEKFLRNYGAISVSLYSIHCLVK